MVIYVKRAKDGRHRCAACHEQISPSAQHFASFIGGLRRPIRVHRGCGQSTEAHRAYAEAQKAWDQIASARSTSRESQPIA